MNKRIVRDGFEYYMEIEVDGGEEYEYGMLLKNEIAHILPFHVMTVNGKRQLIYSASGYRTLENSFDRTVIRKEQLLCIMEAVLNSIDSLNRYLLDPNSLMLTADSIFVDYEYKRVGLVYVPGWRKDIILQLRELMELLLGKIHQADTSSVVLSWKLYLLLKDDHISLKEIRHTLRICEKKENWEEEYDSHIGEKEGDREIIKPEKKEETFRSGKDKKIEKKIPVVLFICVFFTFVLVIGEVILLYSIYAGGILEWKRNCLIINTLLLAVGIGTSIGAGKKELTKKKFKTLLGLKKASKRSWLDLM